MCFIEEHQHVLDNSIAGNIVLGSVSGLLLLSCIFYVIDMFIIGNVHIFACMHELYTNVNIFTMQMLIL